ncbi:tetratricopeptide repeat protein [Vibrio sp. PP-XX7]
MELYDTEEQQVEAIKNWWGENGKAVLIGTVVGLAGIFGWNYYQHSVVTSQETASHQYTDVMSTLSAKADRVRTSGSTVYR